ncbi:MAG: hypothetical protein V4596_07680 [Bdellovibrionota bacterium]
MKNIIWMLFFIITTGAVAGEVGNGGDPLRILFEEARSYTAERVQSAKSCAFSVDVNPEVVSWIMKNKEQLASDIMKSPHVWITDEQSTCAFTQSNPNSTVILSFESCRPGIKSINDAITILAHESVHHFDIADESFADQVGQAIESIGNNCTCDPIPSNDPFDPASCPGNSLSERDLLSKIPLPNQTAKWVGKFKVHKRMRTCYFENHCSPWTDNVDDGGFMLKDPHNGGGYSAQTLGSAAVQLVNNKPQFKLVSEVHSNSAGRWIMKYDISNFSLVSSEASDTTYNALFVGNRNLHWKPVIGKITNTCFRQGISGRSVRLDANGNNILVEYETVILSQFD